MTKKLMSLRTALLVFAVKQSPIALGIASDKEQERPRKDMPVLRKVTYLLKILVFLYFDKNSVVAFLNDYSP